MFSSIFFSLNKYLGGSGESDTDASLYGHVLSRGKQEMKGGGHSQGDMRHESGGQRPEARR